MNTLPAQPNQSLIHGVRVLQALAGQGAPVACTAVARALRLNVTRVNRMLKTLAHLRLVHRTTGRRYAIGPGMYVLATQSLFTSGLMSRALRVLAPLARHGHTVAMGVVWGGMVSYLFHRPPGTRAIDGVGRLTLYPAWRSSIGIALLACQTDAEIRVQLRGQPAVQVRAALRAVCAARACGYGMVTGRVRSLAVTLGTPAFAGIALSGNIAARDVPRFVAILRNAAATMGA
ncbi:MAG: helix-turn-helix domain-containing protein [bacterium]|nr:helix-turn-helix domain-containing protein [bacterium]